jgi:two-component system KDP operon response regulator KdpE
MDELLARMRAAVRRTPAAEVPPRVQLGELMVDLAAKRVSRLVGAEAESPTERSFLDAAGHADPSPSGKRGVLARSGEVIAAAGAEPQPASSFEGSDIRLTPTEWHLLEVLLRNPGKLLSRRQLLNDVWGPGYDNAAGNLRLYMAQLRRKLEPDPARPRWLVTEPGMGYRYQPPDPA